MAVADIVVLGSTGAEQYHVREGLVVNLTRGQVTEWVSPGDYLVRLRASSGQMLIKRVGRIRPRRVGG